MAESSRILFGVTSPVSAKAFLLRQLQYYADHGLQVGLICGHDSEISEWAGLHDIPYYPIAIKRKISCGELGVLVSVTRAIRELQPTIVVMGTPKMASVGLMASRLAGIPYRIYLVHGLRYEGFSGLPKAIMQLVERLNGLLATKTLAVSSSVQVKLASRWPTMNVEVLGHGSANGVDSKYYRPGDEQECQAARVKLGISTSQYVLTFVGRLTRDKGLQQLLELGEMAQMAGNVVLIIAGSSEASNASDRAVVERLINCSSVRYLKEVDDVLPVYWSTDLLVLPTMREGLPTVVLEAAAAGVPTAATIATGTVDAIRDGETGYLFTRENFSTAVMKLLENRRDLSDAGIRAREFVISRYEEEHVWKRWIACFSEIRNG